MSEVKQFEFWPFYWGLSNDDFITQEWGFIYSEWIDNQPSTDFIKVWRKPKKQFSPSNPIESFIEADWDLYWLDDSWNILDMSWNTVYTRSDNNQYVNWIEFNGYLRLAVYKWTANDVAIDRIDISNIDSDWSWDVTEDYKTLSKPTDRDIPMQVVAWTIIIWVWTTVHTIDTNNVVNNYDNLANSKIIDITKSGNIKLFCENWDVIYWDWESDVQSQTLNIWNEIKDVYNQWGTDYLIIWDTFSDAEFWILNWFNVKTIWRKNYSFWIDLDKFWFDRWFWVQQSIEYRKNLFYLIVNTSAQKYIYTYGSKLLWIPKWFSNVLSQASNWNEISTIYAMKLTKDNSDLYISYQDNAFNDLVETIDFSDFTAQESWFLITKTFNWDSNLIKKRINQINVVVSNTAVNNTIDIQYAKDWDTNFTSIKTIDSDYDKKTRETIYNTQMDIWDFYDIKFKLVLNSWVGEWPKLHWLNIIYDSNIEI